jgi:hypothetical protein
MAMAQHLEHGPSVQHLLARSFSQHSETTAVRNEKNA